MLTDERILKWARFVATKFQSNVEGWTYTRDLGKLKHIRYESDYTGYNHWTKRLGRAVGKWNPVTYFAPKDSLDKMFKEKNPTIRGYFMRSWIWARVSLRKDSNLPDGLLNGNPVFWEEDGEYGVLFGPTVGVKVLDFLEAEPENPHAVEILAEMKRMAQKSFPGEDEEDESS